MNQVLPEMTGEVTVILPTYNERDVIAHAIERINKVLKEKLYEIIIIDDDSPDMTWKFAEELNHPKVRVIRRLDERGLSTSIRRGLMEARSKIVVWMDCDLGCPPEVIPQLIKCLPDYDIAIGSRYVDGGNDSRPFWRAALSRVFNLYANLILGFQIRDLTSGFAAVKLEVIQDVMWLSEGFGEYFIEFCVRARKQNLRTMEIGYEYVAREIGESKTDSSILQLLKYGLIYSLFVLDLRFRPLK